MVFLCRRGASLHADASEKTVSFCAWESKRRWEERTLKCPVDKVSGDTGGLYHRMATVRVELLQGESFEDWPITNLTTLSDDPGGSWFRSRRRSVCAWWDTDPA